MKFALAAFITALALLSVAYAGDQPCYAGSWSNGRGETLTISGRTIRFADDRPVPYKDITRATDGQSFQLQITAPGEINAFPGKFLYLSCEDGELTIRQFATGADLQSDANNVGEVHWFRDSD